MGGDIRSVVIGTSRPDEREMFFISVRDFGAESLRD